MLDVTRSIPEKENTFLLVCDDLSIKEKRVTFSDIEAEIDTTIRQKIRHETIKTYGKGKAGKRFDSYNLIRETEEIITKTNEKHILKLWATPVHLISKDHIPQALHFIAER